MSKLTSNESKTLSISFSEAKAPLPKNKSKLSKNAIKRKKVQELSRKIALTEKKNLEENTNEVETQKDGSEIKKEELYSSTDSVTSDSGYTSSDNEDNNEPRIRELTESEEKELDKEKVSEEIKNEVSSKDITTSEDNKLREKAFLEMMEQYRKQMPAKKKLEMQLKQLKEKRMAKGSNNHKKN